MIQSAIKIKIQQKQASLTKSEIVAVISQVESIYSRIISGTATVADYEYIGITGVVKENIYLRGALLGYSKEFVEEEYEAIIDFSELREFEEIAFKKLSSGMKSKLAFSIALFPIVFLSFSFSSRSFITAFSAALCKPA